ncbi:hypothetical protein pb186bvf_017622 [Paramecium bursaria]
MSKRNSTTLKDENRSKRDSAKSNQSQSLFHEHSKNLPEYFAENILFLEMEVESNNVTIENVNQLIELYRIGVEYFESIKSDKFLIFKNKTQQLLLKQCVNQCMNDAYQQQVSTPKVINQGKKLDLELQMQYVRQDNQHDKVSQLIESHGQQSQRVNRLINLDLKNQNEQVLKRLERRRQQSVRIVGQKD